MGAVGLTFVAQPAPYQSSTVQVRVGPPCQEHFSPHAPSTRFIASKRAREQACRPCCGRTPRRSKTVESSCAFLWPQGGCLASCRRPLSCLYPGASPPLSCPYRAKHTFETVSALAGLACCSTYPRATFTGNTRFRHIAFLTLALALQMAPHYPLAACHLALALCLARFVSAEASTALYDARQSKSLSCMRLCWRCALHSLCTAF